MNSFVFCAILNTGTGKRCIMYIWVILATFIVAIASFNLSVRSDIRQIYVAPQAEATISKLALQHEAAEDYVRYQAKSNGAYTAGEVDPASLSSYLPEGFTIDEGAAIDEGHNYSFVYCLDTGTPNLSTKSSTCSGDSYRPYVITYGCIPQRWKSLSDGRPRTELISAMYNVFGFGGHIGYTIPLEATVSEQNIFGSSMGINVRDVKWEAIPQYIISGNEGEHSFYNVCGDNKACDYCLAYISVLPAKIASSSD